MRPKHKSQEEREKFYEIEGILAYKTRRKQPYYLVKWKNFPESQNTWEPRRSLSYSSELVEAFEREKGKYKREKRAHKAHKLSDKINYTPQGKHRLISAIQHKEE